MQSELSLDQVKVMRNDLNDTDLEVVPAQPSRPAGQHDYQPARETRALPILGQQAARDASQPARETRVLPKFAQSAQPAVQHAPVVSDAEPKPSSGRVWSRLTARLFEADV
ncbi:MAG: hypothetical protein HY674_14100 [Chloroflexi bacterium]|nr:hypothetical protein [Chloroflexota bacterium]